MTSHISDLSRYRMFIDGEWVDAASGQSFESLNPYTGLAWATIPDSREEDVNRAVEAARRALDRPDWKGLPPIQ